MTNLAPLRAFWITLLNDLRKLAGALAWLGARVIGRWHWQPPDWVAWAGRGIRRGATFLVADAKRAIAASLAAAGLIAGTVWYKNLPTPHYVGYEVAPPELTE